MGRSNNIVSTAWKRKRELSFGFHEATTFSDALTSNRGIGSEQEDYEEDILCAKGREGIQESSRWDHQGDPRRLTNDRTTISWWRSRATSIRGYHAESLGNGWKASDASILNIRGRNSWNARSFASSAEATNKKSKKGAAKEPSKKASKSKPKTSSGEKPSQQDASDNDKKTQGKEPEREPVHIRLFKMFKEEIHNIFTATPPPKSRGPIYGGSDAPASESTELMKVNRPETAWQKRWGAFKEQAGANPLFQKLHGMKDSSVFLKAREMADDVKDRWETSDNPLVHRIQDLSDSVFGETETAQAIRIIRSRDPDFDTVRFLGTLRKDIPMVLRCYLEGNVEPLKVYCSPEMIERMSGQARAWAAEGSVVDPNILDVADVEMVEVKLFNGEPLVIVQFVAQQINCVRDKFGNVLEGAPDDIQSVYYLWALQQSSEVPASGGPPMWYLREMLVRGMHAII